MADRLQPAGLKKFHRMPRPFHLLRVVIEQQKVTVEGRGTNLEGRVRGIKDQDSPFDQGCWGIDLRDNGLLGGRGVGVLWRR